MTTSLPDPLNVQFPLEMIHIEDRVEKIPECGCWIWMKTLDKDGYGKYGGSGPEKNQMVHRLAYELYKGPIPEGHHVDHTCYVRACVNPYHLEAVTPKENMHRMMRHGTWKKPPISKKRSSVEESLKVPDAA